MGTTYEEDVVAWATEQADLLRAGRLSDIDIEHIAEEIEEVSKGEHRELASRMTVLLAHLLKWQFQPMRRGTSWEATIWTQRDSIKRRLRKTPTLKVSLSEVDGWADIWGDTRAAVTQETGIAFTLFSKTCPWSIEQILASDFYPDEID